MQCDQIGRILKVLGSKFSFNTSPNIWWLFGLFWKPLIRSLNCSGLFLGLFWKNWAIFYFNIWSHCMHYELFSKTYSIFFDPKNPNLIEKPEANNFREYFLSAKKYFEWHNQAAAAVVDSRSLKYCKSRRTVRPDDLIILTIFVTFTTVNFCPIA